MESQESAQHQSPCIDCAHANTQCCSIGKSGYRLYHETVICEDEIEKIRNNTNQGDFFKKIEPEKESPYYILKNDDHGSCVFLDTNNRCSIYHLRPADCRIFPFDFKKIGSSEDRTDGEIRWILWDCLLSNTLIEKSIEPLLVEFESTFQSELQEMIASSASWKNENPTSDFKVLRKMRTPLPS